MARLTVRCGSFADYLVPKLLDDVLRLRSVVCCTVEGIRALERLDDPVAEAWRESATYDAHAWVSQICETAGCGKTIVYQRRAAWQKKYDVDIAT
jgi:hypothetical protein